MAKQVAVDIDIKVRVATTPADVLDQVAQQFSEAADALREMAFA